MKAPNRYAATKIHVGTYSWPCSRLPAWTRANIRIIGAVVGVVIIAIDETLRATNRLRIPPLAVGIGIYLPMSSTFAVVLGAVIGNWYNKRTATSRNPERLPRRQQCSHGGLHRARRCFVSLDAAARRSCVGSPFTRLLLACGCYLKAFTAEDAEDAEFFGLALLIARSYPKSPRAPRTPR